MDGLADNVLRDVLTDISHYDWCVSEFIRVTRRLLPERVFRRVCPELDQGAKTRAGTPIRIQLLGSDPACLAENAARAATFDPFGIDLNFGCPGPTVIRNRGGSALLDEPELLREITAAVRAAVPIRFPVTAKLRLGIRDTEKTLDCVRALEAGGASELVLHARTQQDAYRPPARWEWLGKARLAIKIPLIANGDIWTVDDWRRCHEISGCEDVMLGRGAVADPFLAWRLRADFVSNTGDWSDMKESLDVFWAAVQAKTAPRDAPGRFKLWLGFLRRTWPDAEVFYQKVRVTKHPSEITALLSELPKGAG